MATEPTGTPIPGAAVFVVSLGLVLVTRVTESPEPAQLAFVILALSHLVSGVWALIEGFGQSVGTGLLVLCIPCYVFYFVAVRSQSSTLQWLFAGTWLANILSGFIAQGLVQQL